MGKTEQKQAHTPGPWTMDEGTFVMAEAGPVADVDAFYAHAPIEANLRLISAAPALLEALERLANAVDPDPRDMTLEDWAEEPIRIARQAIAQARGEA